MPDRMIRDGWKTSMRVHTLDDPSENFLLRLMLSADKNGVHPGETEVLRSILYPLKRTLRTVEVARRRDNCSRAGLIHQWKDSDGRLWIRVLKFGQRVPKERPKYPLPPGEIGDDGQTGMPFDGATVDPPNPWKEVKESKGTRAHARTPNHSAKLYPGEVQRLLDNARNELQELRYPGGCAHPVKLADGKLQRAEELSVRIAALKEKMKEFA